jgi:cell division protein ZapA
MGEFVQVTVRILEKEYQVSCPVEERESLMNAADYLNSQMRKIRESGKVVGLERIAVMTALNLTAELLGSKSREDLLDNSYGLRLKSMRERVESALQSGRQLEL